MENFKLTFVDEDEDTNAHCFIDGNRDDGFLIQSFDGYKKSNDFTRRIAAAWNYCHGVPTAELESKGADAGFWGRACSLLETKNEKLEAQNAALLAAVKGMERMLLVLEDISKVISGINTNTYRATLENALNAVKNQTT